MDERLSLEPIGYVRTGKGLKFETPHQPASESGERNVVELLPGRQFELATEDLAGFDRIWLIWWFDRNTTWRPRALPPRGPARRRGLFATRSPHRPNPVGLTCVPLLAVDGLKLTVGALDLMDGTPILDIKPYISTIDAFPSASMGWVGEVERASVPRFKVEVLEPARTQLDWLAARGIDFTDRAFSLLAIDPSPHRTRRILGMGDGLFRMACGPWRLFFRIAGDRVLIERVGKGYSDEALAGSDLAPDREAQLEFGAVWQ